MSTFSARPKALLTFNLFVSFRRVPNWEHVMMSTGLASAMEDRCGMCDYVKLKLTCVWAVGDLLCSRQVTNALRDDEVCFASNRTSVSAAGTDPFFQPRSVLYDDTLDAG